MYTLLKESQVKKISKTEVPPFLIALIIAETLFHFGSFVFECAAFLVTWFAFSFMVNTMFYRLIETRKKSTPV
jgi:hypothetical protein